MARSGIGRGRGDPSGSAAGPSSRLGEGRGCIRVGISGWRYPPWRGVFYPKGLPQRQELAHAGTRFATLEINGTFYSLQRPALFAAWAAAVPANFVFAVKGPRFITHMKRLREVETPLANFLASGLFRLGAKLGPFLWQFPPQMPLDAARFKAFLALLPRDTDEAAALARQHDARLAGRAETEPSVAMKLRHAVEVRHRSFAVPEFAMLLRRHGVALVQADTPEWPYLEDATADFRYLRLHGAEEIYASGYDDAALDRWAARIRHWAAGGDAAGGPRVLPEARPRAGGRDVYVYFDNDAKVRAPADAAGLARRLGTGPDQSSNPEP